MMSWNDGSWGFGNWLAMILTMVVFWGAVIALVVWLVRSVRSEPTSRSISERGATERARQVLAERFARGEVDEEEFTNRRTLLQKSSVGARPAGGE